jgi:hypothetical protein
MGILFPQAVTSEFPDHQPIPRCGLVRDGGWHVGMALVAAPLALGTVHGDSPVEKFDPRPPASAVDILINSTSSGRELVGQRDTLSVRPYVPVSLSKLFTL